MWDFGRRDRKGMRLVGTGRKGGEGCRDAAGEIE